jgi:hypothetical protein
VQVFTDTDGRYRFERRQFPQFLVPARQYTVRVPVPSAADPDPLVDYQPTQLDAGSNDALDNDGFLSGTRTVY